MSSKKELRTVLLSQFMTKPMLREEIRGVAPKEKSGIQKEENAMLDGEITSIEMDEIEPEEDNPHLGPTFYLDDEPLSKEFDKTFEFPITIYVCFYKIVDDLASPFLEFYMEKNEEGFYGFPKTTIESKLEEINELQPIVEPDHVTSQEINTGAIDMYELCESFVANHLTTPESLDSKYYKGFVEMDMKNYVVVFDCSELDFIVENNDSVLAIVDEILYKKNVLGVQIDTTVDVFFQDHEYMKYIVDTDRHPISIPVCMYQVENSTGGYENSMYDDEENRKTDESALDIQMQHPIFGNVYMFSTAPIDVIMIQNMKRHAAFLQDVLYIMNKNFALEENLVANKEDFRDFTGVSFYENGVECMAFYTNGVFMEL